MKESHGRLSGTMPTYSYCGMVEQRPLRSKAETIFRSLIRQLIVSESELPEPILRWYGNRDEQSDNPLGEAVRLIKEIASERSVTYILLDAVDECDGEERGEILKGLEEILQQSSTLIKIFVSSRNDHDFFDFFSGYPNVSIEASKNQGDIEMYINKMVHEAIVEKPKKLLSTVDVSDSLKDQIKRTLRVGAQGM